MHHAPKSALEHLQTVAPPPELLRTTRGSEAITSPGTTTRHHFSPESCSHGSTPDPWLTPHEAPCLQPNQASCVAPRMSPVKPDLIASSMPTKLRTRSQHSTCA
jgi:hypothetical protein